MNESQGRRADFRIALVFLFLFFSLSVASSVECGLHETMVAGSVASSSAVVAS